MTERTETGLLEANLRASDCGEVGKAGRYRGVIAPRCLENELKNPVENLEVENAAIGLENLNLDPSARMEQDTRCPLPDL